MKNIHIKELSYSQDKDERTRRGGERDEEDGVKRRHYLSRRGRSRRFNRI